MKSIPKDLASIATQIAYEYDWNEEIVSDMYRAVLERKKPNWTSEDLYEATHWAAKLQDEGFSYQEAITKMSEGASVESMQPEKEPTLFSREDVFPSDFSAVYAPPDETDERHRIFKSIEMGMKLYPSANRQLGITSTGHWEGLHWGIQHGTISEEDLLKAWNNNDLLTELVQRRDPKTGQWNPHSTLKYEVKTNAREIVSKIASKLLDKNEIDLAQEVLAIRNSYVDVPKDPTYGKIFTLIKTYKDVRKGTKLIHDGFVGRFPNVEALFITRDGKDFADIKIDDLYEYFSKTDAGAIRRHLPKRMRSAELMSTAKIASKLLDKGETKLASEVLALQCPWTCIPKSEWPTEVPKSTKELPLSLNSIFNQLWRAYNQQGNKKSYEQFYEDWMSNHIENYIDQIGPILECFQDHVEEDLHDAGEDDY